MTAQTTENASTTDTDDDDGFVHDVIEALDHEELTLEHAIAIAAAAGRYLNRHRSDQQEYTGTINRWDRDSPHGFAGTADHDGKTRGWRVRRSDLPSGVMSLPRGTQITFVGAIVPRHASHVDDARNVRIAEGDRET